VRPNAHLFANDCGGDDGTNPHDNSFYLLPWEWLGMVMVKGGGSGGVDDDDDYYGMTATSISSCEKDDNKSIAR